MWMKSTPTIKTQGAWIIFCPVVALKLTEQGSTSYKNENTHDILNLCWRCLLKTFICLFKHVHVCGRGLTDESEIIKFLQHGTLVGLLPVPHPILIRKYQVHFKTVNSFFAIYWKFCEEHVVYFCQDSLLFDSFFWREKTFFSILCMFFFSCRPTVALKCGSEPTCGELSTSGKI